MVLATDMQQHTSLLARLRDSIAHKRSRNEWFSSSNIEDRKFLLSIAIHLADISSASKKTYVSLEWAIRVHDEFWKQGDLEREKQIAVSAVMDRNKPNFQKSQIGFINFIVDPLVKLFVQVVPQVEACIVQQNVNLSYWKARISVLEEIRNGKHDRDHRS